MSLQSLLSEQFFTFLIVFSDTATLKRISQLFHRMPFSLELSGVSFRLDSGCTFWSETPRKGHCVLHGVLLVPPLSEWALFQVLSVQQGIRVGFCPHGANSRKEFAKPWETSPIERKDLGVALQMSWPCSLQPHLIGQTLLEKYLIPKKKSSCVSVSVSLGTTDEVGFSWRRWVSCYSKDNIM